MGNQKQYYPFVPGWNGGFAPAFRENGNNAGQQNQSGIYQKPNWGQIQKPGHSNGSQTQQPATEETTPAVTLPGMTQMDPYVGKEYVQSDAVTQAQQMLHNMQANKPGAYQSQFQTGLDALMGQIQNRDKFQYDVNSDALYQQVMQNYLAQGQQAMMDTMGQAAAMTGGYGNSYAQTAGQQMYNQHLLGLAELVPQYQQMALQQYQMEGDQLMDQYQLMLQQEESAYGRYQDDLNRYYADLDRAQAAYDNERDYDYSRFADDRDFDYGKYMDDLNYQYQVGRDQVADDQWAQQWAYQQERDKIKDEQWQKEYEESVRQFNENLAFQQAQAARSSSGGGGGRSGGGVGSGSGGSSGGDTMSLPMAAAQVAKQYSVEDAVDWVNSTNESQATKNAAIQNAMGVAQTEYYRKQAEALAKNRK